MENKINGRPFGKRVLVEKNKKEETEDEFINVGGLLVPKPTQEDGYIENSGTIVALGTDLDDSALEYLQIGTNITFSNPHEITFNGDSYYIVHENNIDMIVTP